MNRIVHATLPSLCSSEMCRDKKNHYARCLQNQPKKVKNINLHKPNKYKGHQNYHHFILSCQSHEAHCSPGPLVSFDLCSCSIVGADSSLWRRNKCLCGIRQFLVCLSNLRSGQQHRFRLFYSPILGFHRPQHYHVLVLRGKWLLWGLREGILCLE